MSGRAGGASAPPITRRDFINGILAGSGAALLAAPPPAAAAAPDTFSGYGGVGDYAHANGNTWPVLEAAHRIRDGRYDAKAFAAARPAGDFDLIVVGGGIAGLSAAYHFHKATGGRRRVLILENHSMPGGEARQNELLVAGARLLGPQGSNDFLPPSPGSGSAADAFFTALGIPREYEWQPWDSRLKSLRFARDNYSSMDGFQETQVDVGYFFDAGQGSPSPRWLRNIWSNGLGETPFSGKERADLLRWRADSGPMGEAEERALDRLTYKDYLEKVRGYDPAVTRFHEPIVGLLSGVSADAACARLGRQLVEAADRPMAISFPGGNAPFPRALLRGLLPDALPGTGFDSLLYGSVRFAEIDREGSPTRIRLNATAVRVRHEGDRSVEVIYEQGGRLWQVRAKGVAMASGGWINRHILADMPPDLEAAYAQFTYAPALIINVALRQWRFLYDLGITACRWFDDDDGFGYCANIRQSMITAEHSPPLHPDHPAVLSLYMGLPVPGLPAAQQGTVARARLLATPYRDYEQRVRAHLTRLFASQGFHADRDIAAIVLNRWGHARLIEPPGFHYGVDGRPSPLERVRQGYGRIAIGHSELNGAQHWGTALDYGRKAGEHLATLTG